MRFLKKIPMWGLFCISMVVSSLWVGLALAGRQEGYRIATDGGIPMRQPTLREAGALLAHAKEYSRKHNYPCTAVIELSENEVVIATVFYLLKGRGYQDIMEDIGTEKYRGVLYAVVFASWDYYYLVHHFDRKKLESEIGREFIASDVDAKMFQNRQMSFDSNRIWYYFLVETVFMAVLFFLFLLVLKKYTSYAAAIWAFTLLQIPLLMFVPYYSPAFWDADFFFQRILIESLWMWSSLLLFWISLGLSGITLFVFLFNKFRDKNTMTITGNTQHETAR